MKKLLVLASNNKRELISFVLGAIVTVAIASMLGVNNSKVQDVGTVKAASIFDVEVVEDNVEVYRDTSDQRIIADAKYAVSAKLNGKEINSKDVVMSTTETGIASNPGERDVTFVASYKTFTKNIVLHYTVLDSEEPTAPKGGSDASKSGSKKAVYHKNALATSIKAGQMMVKGLDGVYVSTKGFANPETAKDVVASSVKNAEASNESTLKTADKKVDVDSTFKTSDKEVEEAKKIINEVTSDKEVKVNDKINEVVAGATSKEVETTVVNNTVVETPVKPTASLIVVRLADGKVLNLTSNLSGNVSGATCRLAQQADGSFKDLSTGKTVDFNLGASSEKIIDGFSSVVTVYNTNCGIYYVA